MYFCFYKPRVCCYNIHVSCFDTPTRRGRGRGTATRRAGHIIFERESSWPIMIRDTVASRRKNELAVSTMFPRAERFVMYLLQHDVLCRLFLVYYSFLVTHPAESEVSTGWRCPIYVSYKEEHKVPTLGRVARTSQYPQQSWKIATIDAAFVAVLMILLL